MDKIDWKRKLTSRKFWAAIIGFVTPTLLAFGVAETEVTQVTSIIMAGATLIAYIIGEGMTDAAYAGTGTSNGIMPDDIDVIEIEE